MSLGPLTTTFVPPPSCTNSFTNFYAVTPELGVLYAVGGPLSTSNCFPPNYEFSRSNFYSPGVCPAGFTSACSSLYSIGTVTETAVTCCPPQFACDLHTDLDWQMTMGCSSSILTLATTVTVITNGLTSTYTSTITGGGLNAYSVQVRFQESDVKSTTHIHSTSSTSTSLTPTSLTPTPIRTSTETATYTSTVLSSGGGTVSSGVAAAIGICSAIGAFLVSILVASIFFRRRRIEKSHQRVEMSGYQQPNMRPQELQAPL